MLCSRAGCAPRSAVLWPPVPGEAGLVCAAIYRTLALGAPWRQTVISAARHPRRSGTCRPWLSKRSAAKGLAEHGGEGGPGVEGGGRGSPGDEPVRPDDDRAVAGDQQEPPRRDDVLDRAAAPVLVIEPRMLQRPPGRVDGSYTRMSSAGAGAALPSGTTAADS